MTSHVTQEDVKRYAVVTGILYDGKQFVAGSQIHLTPDEAKRFLDEGSLKLLGTNE